MDSPLMRVPIEHPVKLRNATKKVLMMFLLFSFFSVSTHGFKWLMWCETNPYLISWQNPSGIYMNQTTFRHYSPAFSNQNDSTRSTHVVVSRCLVFADQKTQRVDHVTTGLDRRLEKLAQMLWSSETLQRLGGGRSPCPRDPWIYIYIYIERY